MSLAVYSHPDMLGHDAGHAHPEQPARLTAVVDALRDGAPGLDWREAPLAAREDLARVHPDRYVEALLQAAPREGRVQLDPDTALSPGSLPAALRAAGAVIEAVRATGRGEHAVSFCAVRPPGHHAEPERAMGFCLFSSVAAAVRVAQAEGIAQRVAVVDFDVHHGNGTQAVFESDPDVLFLSIHQAPLYPGTGDPSETGVGNVVNATAPPNAPRELWRRLFETRLMPELDAFAPELILVSAGFDAHARDPLAQQQLEGEDFAWATRAILDVARARAGGRVVSSLEGGYDLQALGRSALAHVQALREG